MVSHLFFYQLTLIALVWLCVLLHWAWPSDSAAACPSTLDPTPPQPKRHREPTPFVGLTTKPHCDACEHNSAPYPQPPAPAPAHSAHAGATPPGRHLTPFLPQSGLCLSGLGGMGQSPRQWPSQWGALATAAVCRLSRLFSRDPGHDVSW
jgi:hypothetical protein